MVLKQEFRDHVHEFVRRIHERNPHLTEEQQVIIYSIVYIGCTSEKKVHLWSLQELDSFMTHLLQRMDAVRPPVRADDAYERNEEDASHAIRVDSTLEHDVLPVSIPAHHDTVHRASVDAAPVKGDGPAHVNLLHATTPRLPGSTKHVRRIHRHGPLRHILRYIMFG